MRSLALGLCLGALACAKIEAPRGGPIDRTPPMLRLATPDSLRSLAGFDEAVTFEFDEVVSEGSSPNFGLGTGDLERLIVLSPSNEVPSIRWKRNRITVRPRGGWLPNTTYRVELLPGIADLSRNPMTRGAVVTFTTGGPLPTDTLVGRLVDWTTQRPAPFGLVEAVLQPDSLVYRTAADSTGRFRFGPLPRGEYLVYGVLEEGSKNNRFDPREKFDTIRVAAGVDSVGEIWAFKHDTVAARITQLARQDSMAIAITFNQSLSPYQRLLPDSAAVLLLPDSTQLPVVSLLPAAVDDSIVRARTDSVAKARADSIAREKGDSAAPSVEPTAPAPAPVATRDTAGARVVGIPRQVAGVRPAGRAERDTMDMAPLTTKPSLFDKLTLRTGTALRPGQRLVVIVRGVRSVSGVAGEARSVLVLEPPRPTKADSLRADSLRADSLRSGTAAPRPDSAGAGPRPAPPIPADTARGAPPAVVLRPRRP